ncbi:ATP-binding protein [Clostridium botulinum]|uniref:ATP-binding protein n=2 Tax=Clostridium botulinum TaxID=1491 RepID=A0A846IGC7_CLOBO|nr:GHKL domain-containing protein [Clostridium botulinum]KEI83282.1 VirS [Clostridium botulinum A2 117]KEI93874.1 VirS [Clostridium botulinum B2 275]KEJ04029.1 VirS [Clostridium botulinum F 357]MBE1303698.1 GHKL domain-containing protein [Clostridium botulinum]MBN3417029.1 ATP-binding protein [Clostridium botulinum]
MELKWFFYEFTVNIIEALLAYNMLKIFFRRKIENNLKISLIIFFQAGIVQLINLYFGIASYYGLLILIIINILIYYFILEGNLMLLILSIIIYMVLLCFIEILSVKILTFFLNITPDVMINENIYRIIGVIISRGFIYISIIFLRNKKLKNKKINKYIYEFIIIFIINLFFIFIVFNIYKQNKFIERYWMLLEIITFSIIIFTIEIIKIFKHMTDYCNKEIEWLLKESEYKTQINYVKSMHELIFKLKAQRHDFNHHISCICGLLEMNQTDEAIEYIKQINSDISEIDNIVTINNVVIESILNYKLSYAKNQNIKLGVDVHIPENLIIKSVDISILLGNAIDNAIEACKDLEEKFINMEIYNKHKYLIIKISNSKRNKIIKENKQYKTTKDDKENHGFGLKNIKYIVDSYEGLLKIDESENKFTINIALKNED